MAKRDHAFRDEVAKDFALGIFSARADRMPPDSELNTAPPTALKDYALERIASWHPDLTAVIGLRDTDTVQPLTLRSHIPAAARPPSSVTLVGDAVHAMSPALGVGANTALRDARSSWGLRSWRQPAEARPCRPRSGTSNTPCAATGSTPCAPPHTREPVIGHLPLPV
ncbi:FAD-dependent monooxygenase [Kitasatospora aureofaciens]|uniref:FAD-dependent oxidoreductase n=1 Tax=Kitasatospora aureofaciens TaxID=1894 RepID=UPI00052512A9|nr:FAD-dependent monooxygenase [Kitasatospora aureofaciens]HJD84396.1 FAD-dependent monooxygenase [Kitasatospora aureofaciens]